jgi:hypothetical protein
MPNEFGPNRSLALTWNLVLVLQIEPTHKSKRSIDDRNLIANRVHEVTTWRPTHRRKIYDIDERSAFIGPARVDADGIVHANRETFAVEGQIQRKDVLIDR